MSRCHQSTRRRPKSKNSAAISAWRKPRCRKWVTSSSAATQRKTFLRSGKKTRTQNSCPKATRSFVVRSKTNQTRIMNTETTTGEYMLLFRGPHWDKGLSRNELQHAMNEGVPWFEGLNERGKTKGAQPLGGEGRITSGTDVQFVVDGPFAESKEAVGG